MQNYAFADANRRTMEPQVKGRMLDEIKLIFFFSSLVFLTKP